MKRLVLIIGTVVSLIATVAFLWDGRTAFSQQARNGVPQSKLGLKGEMGFIIRVIDPGSPLEQAGLKIGDIIVGLNGQVTGIEKFQRDIAASEPGTAFEVSYLRFDPATGRLDERTVTVRTIPFSARAEIDKVSFLRVRQECPSSCCANCGGLLPGEQSCITEDHFTGKGFCFIRDGRCNFYYCA